MLNFERKMSLTINWTCQSVKYTWSGWTDIGLRKLKFVANNQFHWVLVKILRDAALLFVSVVKWIKNLTVKSLKRNYWTKQKLTKQIIW